VASALQSGVVAGALVGLGSRRSSRTGIHAAVPNVRRSSGRAAPQWGYYIVVGADLHEQRQVRRLASVVGRLTATSSGGGRIPRCVRPGQPSRRRPPQHRCGDHRCRAGLTHHGYSMRRPLGEGASHVAQSMASQARQSLLGITMPLWSPCGGSSGPSAGPRPYHEDGVCGHHLRAHERSAFQR
jgi:hypothetical protein